MKSAAHGSPPASVFEDLIRQLESLRGLVIRQTDANRAALLELPAERYHSAENLLHYLAMRSQDIRLLQDRLARLGLSSLGRAEAHVLATINAVLHNLYLVSGHKLSAIDSLNVYADFDAGVDQLELNTRALLGEHPQHRRGHIVVTMSSEAADDYLLVHRLLTSGMNCMRINCVHDDPSRWSRMIEHLRNAEKSTGLSCKVLMDLGGPKLRLGPMEPMQPVLKIRPVRSSDGQIIRPARIWISAAGESYAEMPAADVSVALDADWLEAMRVGDRVCFIDNRASCRNWQIPEVAADGCWAEAKKTAYLVNGTVLSLHHDKHDSGFETELRSLPPQESISLVRTGDTLIMSLTGEPGKPALHDSNGVLLNPGQVSLPIAEVFRDIRLGEPVAFDDGRMSGIVEKCDATRIYVRITHTRKQVESLEGRRGINLPDTRLDLPTLGAKDRRDLGFAVRHADMIGLSFANSPADVRTLHRELEALGREDIGVVLKIETKKGFTNLPAMLLEALKFSTCGVMIARGDLAVECGFERLSELQEEILWICESAHVPVIWATQVLESLTKRGHVTRAEITDAAMAQSAEAVMLNKGPYIVEAVEMLDDILQRMQGHHRKKHSVMRQLNLAAGFQKARETLKNPV
jgi:pyruvate kinase